MCQKSSSDLTIALDDFWHTKYSEDEEGRAVRREEADQILLELEEDGLNPSEHIALPNPSYFPIVLASGLPFLGYAVIYKSIPLALIDRFVTHRGIWLGNGTA